jgi:hypothetical protein
MEGNHLMHAFFLAAAAVGHHVIAETNPFQHCVIDNFPVGV